MLIKTTNTIITIMTVFASWNVQLPPSLAKTNISFMPLLCIHRSKNQNA